MNRKKNGDGIIIKVHELRKKGFKIVVVDKLPLPALLDPGDNLISIEES